MSLLNDGALKELFGSVLGSSDLFGETVTLRTRVTSIDADGVNTGAWIDATATGTPIELSKYRRQSERIPDAVAAIIVYQRGAGATPVRGGRIVSRGVEYEILSVEPDPADATWTLQVRP